MQIDDPVCLQDLTDKETHTSVCLPVMTNGDDPRFCLFTIRVTNQVNHVLNIELPCIPVQLINWFPMYVSSSNE